MSASEVWLGTVSTAAPPLKFSELQDPYISRIGGVASWLLAPVPRAACVECDTDLTLVSQLHAPLSVFDRVIYVFFCVKCSGNGGGVIKQLTVLRAQVYNADYDTAVDAAATAAPLFTETDDWGSGSDEEPTAAVEGTPLPAADRFPAREVCEGVVAEDVMAFRSFHVDIAREPRAAHKEVPVATAEELALVEMSPACDAGGGVGDDDGTAREEEDAVQADYMQRLERWPTQVIRWQPGGEPLLARLTPMPPRKISPCELCGGPRVFEFQLVSPLVFFLTRGIAEKHHALHFSTVFVYTCASHCMSDLPYASEYGFVQHEF
jgi:pre-rRNA-processing protein TSR4